MSNRRVFLPNTAAAVPGAARPEPHAPPDVSAGQIHFVIPGPPVPKGRPRFTLNGHTYTPPRTAEAEARIRDHLKVAYPHFRMLRVDCALFIDVYLKGQARGDWDNFGKLVSDALNRVAYEDDSLIQDARVRKFYDSDRPRTEITLYPLPDVGRGAA